MGIEHRIDGADKLIRVFGRWPAFRDGDVQELRLARGPMEEGMMGPVLLCRLHLFEMGDGAAEATLMTGKHTGVTFRFSGVEELEMADFGVQNILEDLRMEERGELFSVRFVPAFGLSLSFTCERIDILNVDKSLPGAPFLLG